uniref:Replicase n=1 Tax=Helenium virus S TaxID=12171 RepID=A0A7U0MGT0_HELVS|nr:replicase [Helenium virus S]
MALTYRSPLEANVATYDSTVQAALTSTSANHYRDVEKENFRFFNYNLSSVAKQHLIEAGVYVSPNAAMPHSHPVCKTLENHFLYTVLPPLLDNTFYFVGIKNFKLDFIKSRNSKLTLVGKINRYVTSLDLVRYGPELVVRSTASVPGLKRHEPHLEGSTLKDLVPPLLARSAKNLFIHDELHYWSVRDLITFLEVISPTMVYATAVIPPELLVGAKTSLNRWCYTYEIVGKDLLFYPDNVRTEGYQQPLASIYLLKTNKIKLTNGSSYDINLVHSKFAHHLFAITPSKAVNSTIRAFGPFEATTCTGLNPLLRNVNHFFPIPFAVISRVYRYLRTLKKPDEQSSMAKLSQLIPEPSGPEIKFLQDFSSLVIGTDKIRTTIAPERLKLFLGGLLGKLPNFLAERFNVVKEIALDDFITNFEPFHFHVKLIEVNWGYSNLMEIFDSIENEQVENPYAELPNYLHCSQVVFDSRYRSCHRLDNRGLPMRATLLEVPIKALEIFAVRHIIQVHLSPVTRKVSNRSVRGLLSKLIKHRKFPLLARKEALKKIIDASWISKRIRTACSRFARMIRILWNENPSAWFLDGARYNQFYLTNEANQASWYKEGADLYKKVVGELLSGGLPILKRRATGFSPRFKEKVEQRAEPEEVTKEPVDDVQVPVQPVFNEIRQMLPFICSCGLTMEVSSMRLPGDHAFSCPDALKNRRAGWYSKGNAPYKYNGGHHTSQGWPEWLEKWMFINDIDSSYYNCCLFQMYDEGATIGFHSDDEAIFERGAAILTCNLQGNADFSIRCRMGAASYKLTSATQFTMPEGFQITHKHSVRSTSQKRTSLTFRRMVEAVGVTQVDETDGREVEEVELGKTAKEGGEVEHSGSLEVSEIEEPATPASKEQVASDGDELKQVDLEIGVMEVSSPGQQMNYHLDNVPGDGDCFWRALEVSTKMRAEKVKELSGCVHFPGKVRAAALEEQMGHKVYAQEEAIIAAATVLRTTIHVFRPCYGRIFSFRPNSGSAESIYLYHNDEHFQVMRPMNVCVISSIANALNRKSTEIMHVLGIEGGEIPMSELWKGEGVALEDLDFYFELFDISASVECGGEAYIINDGGRVPASFRLSDGHLEFCGKNCGVNVDVLKGENKALSFTDKAGIYLRNVSTPVEYKPQIARAKVLADSFEAGCTGVLNSKLFNDADNLMNFVDIKQDDQARGLNVILGTFGSGKSTVFKRIFEMNPGKGITYVSPRRALAEEFKGKLLGRGAKKGAGKLASRHWRVQTFEVAVKQLHMIKPGMCLIIDEIQLYPPGYLDLVLLTIDPKVVVILGGDPCQSDYDNEQDRAWLGGMDSDISQVLRDAEYSFNILSQRFQNGNFSGRLPCEINPERVKGKAEEHLLYTGLTELLMIPNEYKEVFLVSSFEEKKIVETHFIGDELKVLTFGESTGLNFKFGTIIITNVSSLTSEKRWVTALSRFSQNLCFVNLVGTDWSSLCQAYRGRCLGRFLSKTANPDDLKEHLPGRPAYQKGFNDKVGKDEGLREEKMQGDPWLKGMIDLFQLEDVEEVEIMEEVMQEEWFKTHLPQTELESVRARWVHKILAKEFREVRSGYETTEQFTDDYAKEPGKILSNAAERFETIYPRHRANDSVTFFMAVKKRLRFSNPATEKAKLIEASCYGKFLLQEFLKKVPLNAQHEPVLMAKAKADFENKKVSKSAATIENHSGRSCRDWLADIGLVFSKSQLCTKFDNRFRVAKAAQSIVCFQHEVLCRFAPYMRYIEMKLQKALPENYYIHSGKGLDELNEWVKKGRFDGICTESDYEAFDASQDQFIVAFEVAVMQYLGLPWDLIEDYKFIKTHLGSKLGNFAIMRFSGEASTFLFNTMANMLFTFLRYEIKGNEFICFAGDDMCASKQLPIKREHEGFLNKLKLKAKVFMVEKPTFCGWHLCPDGIYKKPQLVMERMCIAKEKNNLANCIDNYAIEVSFAYRLGERAVNRMDEEELEAFYNCVRIIVKNKHLLKSEIAHLYSKGLSELRF